jgi:hypothetical protein
VTEPDPHSFLPLPASAMHILVALADGEKHGYAIMRDIETISGGSVTMGSGTLYGSIKRMLDQGLLEETEQRPDPALDQRVGTAEQHRLSRLLDVATARRLGLAPGFGTAT